MEFRQLGDSDIEVSEISLGSWLTYGGGLEQDQTEACTRAAFDAGINFFDTSNIYGVGAAETAWGEILKNFRREEFIVATKLFFPMDADSGGLSREEVHKQIDASLERLQTDYVDLYQCHRPDPDTPIEETMEALTEVCEAGKAREIGFSEWTVEQIEASLEVPGAKKFVSSQPQYNMIWRRPRGRADPLLRGARHLADRLVAPRAGSAHRQVQPGRAATRGLARGLGGDGRDDGSLPVGRAARGGPATPPNRRGRRGEHGHLGPGLGPPPGRTSPAPSSAPRGPEQVHQNAEASGVKLDQNTLGDIDDALDGVTVTGPRLANFVKEGVTHR